MPYSELNKLLLSLLHEAYQDPDGVSVECVNESLYLKAEIVDDEHVQYQISLSIDMPIDFVLGLADEAPE